jgi:uncharacterized membrane protein YccF (DUF307 family)
MKTSEIEPLETGEKAPTISGVFHLTGKQVLSLIGEKDWRIMQNTTVVTRENPGCLVQILWFAFVGWWLGQIWMIAAWVLMVTIIGIPIGVSMLNHLPKVIALREPAEQIRVSTRADGSLARTEVDRPQINILLRALYFVLIGWWLSAVWMEAAYAVSLTVIGLPVGFWMFDRVPVLLSLKR